MATLVGNVNASAAVWTVSADIPDTTDYLEVDSEIVQISAHFPGTTLRGNYEVIPPKIRVQRAAGGTTAASHLSGATLTPVIPPSAGAGSPGGALTVTDGTTSVEATTISLTGATVTDEGAGVAGADTGVPDSSNGDENDVIQIIGGAYSLGPVPTGFSEGDHDALDHAPVFPVEVIASGGTNANSKVSAETVDGAASAGAEADATGEGNAVASVQATAATGSADVDVGAQSTEGDATISLRATQDAAQAGFIISVTGAGVEQILALGLPTSNPNVAGALWNDTGSLKVSAG